MNGRRSGNNDQAAQDYVAEMLRDLKLAVSTLRTEISARFDEMDSRQRLSEGALREEIARVERKSWTREEALRERAQLDQDIQQVREQTLTRETIEARLKQYDEDRAQRHAFDLAGFANKYWWVAVLAFVGKDGIVKLLGGG